MNRKTYSGLQLLIVVITLMLPVCVTRAGNTTRLTMEEFMIPGADPGVKLYVRNKHRADLKHFTPNDVVLFVHGATFPSETSFDLELDGLSWMDYLAQHGYDTYLVDIRGYGKSSRPSEMNDPAEFNPPIVRTNTAARDFGAAVDFILKRRQIAKLNIIGWSWGTAITALYTSQHNAKIERLVLLSPVWLRKGIAHKGNTVNAYRIVKAEPAFKFLARGAPPGTKLMPDSWKQVWIHATFASDPVGAKANPPYLRAPNGVNLDREVYWAVGKPVYNPANIHVPALIILGGWDAITPVKTAHALFTKLSNAYPKEFIVLKRGTHGVMMQNNRMELFKDVQRFLDTSQATIEHGNR